MKGTPQRFHDDGTTLYGLGDLVLVECPRCHNSARMARKISREPYECSYTLSCGHCGCSRSNLPDTRESTQPSLGLFMGHRLWLRTRACGQYLWALNETHLDYLERYIAAELRERAMAMYLRSVWDPCFTFGKGRLANCVPRGSGVRHFSRLRNGYHLVSRLPRWMVLKSNREPVLKGIAKLRALLPPEGGAKA